MESTSAVPLAASAFDPNIMAVPGYALDANFSSNGTTAEAAFRDTESEGALDFTAGPGAVTIRTEEGEVFYQGGATGLAATVASSDLPAPVNVSLESYGYTIGLPLPPKDDASSFAMGLSFKGVTIDDFLWTLLAPGSVLPREPATLSTLIDGLPAPTGRANFTVLGANGLIENLVRMGLLPEDQAFGARMMLGLFAVPGEGEDELLSTIEVQSDGSVFANGQQLR